MGALGGQWRDIEAEHFGHREPSISDFLIEARGCAKESLDKAEASTSPALDALPEGEVQLVLGDLRKGSVTVKGAVQEFHSRLESIEEWVETGTYAVEKLKKEFEGLLRELDSRSAWVPDSVAIQVAETDRARQHVTQKDEASDKAAFYERFFRTAYAGSLQLLGRLASTDAVSSAVEDPVLLAKAYNEAAEGLSQIENPTYREVSVRWGERVIRLEEPAVSLAEKYKQAKKNLQAFYRELKKIDRELEGESLGYKRDYEALLYELALGVPQVLDDRTIAGVGSKDRGREVTSCDAAQHNIVRAKIQLYDSLKQYSDYFSKVTLEAPRFRQWWHDIEITTSGSKQRPSISDALEQARIRAQAGLDQVEGAVAAFDWSFEELQEEERSLLNVSVKNQEEDTEENVLAPLISFSNGLHEQEGLARYKEEYGRFMGELAELHPSLSSKEVSPFPDPHGPTELEEKNAELEKEKRELVETLEKLQREKQTFEQERQMLEREHRRLEQERWALAEEVQELKASRSVNPTFTDLNTTMKRIEEKEDERERRAQQRRIRQHPTDPRHW